MHWEDEKFVISFGLESRKEQDHMEDVGVDGRKQLQ
jgi:hypothetical protein